jgi:hypothetical protein
MEIPERKNAFSQKISPAAPSGMSFSKVVCGRNAPGMALEQHGKAGRDGSE